MYKIEISKEEIVAFRFWSQKFLRIDESKHVGGKINRGYLGVRRTTLEKGLDGTRPSVLNLENVYDGPSLQSARSARVYRPT